MYNKNFHVLFTYRIHSHKWRGKSVGRRGVKAQKGIPLNEELVKLMDVATLKDVCDNLDPLCSPDDSCHILILHI